MHARLCVCSAGHGRGNAKPLFTLRHHPLSALCNNAIDRDGRWVWEVTRQSHRQHVKCSARQYSHFCSICGRVKKVRCVHLYMVFMPSVWKPPGKSSFFSVWTVLCLVTRVVFVVNVWVSWVCLLMIVRLCVETVFYLNKGPIFGRLELFIETVEFLFSRSILALFWPRGSEHPLKVLNQSHRDRSRDWTLRRLIYGPGRGIVQQLTSRSHIDRALGYLSLIQ